MILGRAKYILVTICLIFSSGCATTASTSGYDAVDPIQGVNRVTFAFNDAFDAVLFKPLAKGYDTVVPEPVDIAVSNFFSNLREIDSAVNNLFQGKFNLAANDIGRFAINSTFGVGGLIDIASDMGMQKTGEDFGQTLGYYGSNSGAYLVLPIIGSNSMRDLPGTAISMILNPLAWLDDISLRNQLVGTSAIDTRSDLLAKEEIAEEISKDKYTLYRNSYLDERDFAVNDGKMDASDIEKDLE
ncbi:MAG: ABC transporter [Gammaproteobacteria bacterium]|nr:ABC transporter [Gammaproteobacteria bacterium]|tara:strand:- start:6801 stop:7529 length:729 start_codon:yes stop_codon:yes gene_type:complete